MAPNSAPINSPQSVTAVLTTHDHEIALTKEDALLLPPHSGNGYEVDGIDLIHKHPRSGEAKWNELPSSLQSQRTKNPIRAVVDPILDSYHKNNAATPKQQQTKQEFISLALGDPTAFGDFEPCPIVQRQDSRSFTELLSSSACYVNALGSEETRQAIATFHSGWKSDCVHARLVDPEHVVVASGCSGALELALRALLDPGTFLLVPNPGFPLYKVIAENLGANVVPYDLLPDQEWQINLLQVIALVEEYRSQGRDIRAMVVNNPSNPTGTVYSHEHLKNLVNVSDLLCLPLVSDEIYGELTYDLERPFIPLANVVATMAAESRLPMQVPIITCSGVGKQFLVPGWRIGWAVFYDNAAGSIARVEQGTKRLAQIVLGASHLAQKMATNILTSLGDPAMVSWQQDIRQTLAAKAVLLAKELAFAPGLRVYPARGAMYLMVTLEGPNDHDFTANREPKVLFDFLRADWGENHNICNATMGERFCARLLEEENILVLPGSCFGSPNAFRIVFCAPELTIREAAKRIVDFCGRHYSEHTI